MATAEQKRKAAKALEKARQTVRELGGKAGGGGKSGGG